MSEQSSNYPDFHKPAPSDTLEPEELKRVRGTFNDFFDDLMLRHMDAVKQFKLSSRTSADLSANVVADGEEYSIHLEDRGERDGENRSGIQFRDSEKLQRIIYLQRKDGVYGREHWSYRLGADGIVRRWDGGDAYGKLEEERKLGIAKRPLSFDDDVSVEAAAAIARKGLEDLVDNGIPNTRLEEDMGLNNQPVTLEEIQGLKDFIARAEFQPKTH